MSVSKGDKSIQSYVPWFDAEVEMGISELPEFISGFAAAVNRAARVEIDASRKQS